MSLDPNNAGQPDAESEKTSVEPTDNNDSAKANDAAMTDEALDKIAGGGMAEWEYYEQNGV